MVQGLSLLGAPALAIPAQAQTTDEPVVAVVRLAEAADDPRAAMSEAFGQDTLENGKFLWTDGTTEVDRLALRLTEQLIYAYDDDRLVAVSTVSTGRAGHETLPGSFKVLAKYRRYFSKKYDNAPMPYMQQITSYGVALHAGRLPGYPASHGCIRLPDEFAAKLFEATKIGTPVLITK
uniref:L,D-transpeptidase family protein n=1 Tax=Altererythrobacter segetis TaxID=1104773 RepID=UPI001FAF4F74|nr:L,D-transpeptidase family protein [Altererythrobacter segetis]